MAQGKFVVAEGQKSRRIYDDHIYIVETFEATNDRMFDQKLNSSASLW